MQVFNLSSGRSVITCFLKYLKAPFNFTSNLSLKLCKTPQEIQNKSRASRLYLACYKVLSLISKREVVILEAYQDLHDERNLENSKNLYRRFLSNASGSDTNYTHRAEQCGWDTFLRDTAHSTMPSPQKKHGLGNNFSMDNLMNACHSFILFAIYTTFSLGS